jgi:carbohydrate-binding DOMON domain-containing protein
MSFLNFEFYFIGTKPRWEEKTITIYDEDVNQALFVLLPLTAKCTIDVSLEFMGITTKEVTGTASYAYDQYRHFKPGSFINYGKFDGYDENGFITSVGLQETK